MKLCYKLCIASVVLLLASISACAGELAILRNGSAIRYERREQKDAVTTRLYLTETSHDYVDVPVGEIVRFEVEDIDLPEMPPRMRPSLIKSAASASSANPAPVVMLSHSG
jgi:hypothetical protein